MKDRFWFEHDSNAHSDPKITHLRMKYGLAAYGAFWVIIEKLRDSDDYTIDVSLLDAICFDMRIEREWVDTMFDIGLLKRDDKCFWSGTLVMRMAKWDEKKARRAAAGRKGGNAKAMLQQCQSNATAMPKQCSDNAVARTEQNITEQNKEIPPLGEHAQAREPKPKTKQKRATQLSEDWQPNSDHFALAKQLGVDADFELEKFRDHAKSNEWKKKDWDATFRNWLRNEFKFSRSSRASHRPPSQKKQVDLDDWARRKEQEIHDAGGDSKEFEMGFGLLPEEIRGDRDDV